MDDVSFQSSSVYRCPFLGGAAYSPCTAAGKSSISHFMKLYGSSEKHVPRCLPATDDVRMTRFSVSFAVAAASRTFRVPFTAGSIRSFWGSLLSIKKGDL